MRVSSRKKPATPISWTLLRTPQLSAIENMALDGALLRHAIEHATADPVVRVYEWAKPALSLGRHQVLSEGARMRCDARGLEVVKRPTGGTAVLHGGDITYSVVSPVHARSVLEAYRWVALPLAAGLLRMGLTAEVGEHAAGPATSPACFASTRGADLQVSGRKICGSAQVRRAGWFLQHGSIPLDDPWPLTRELLEQPASSPHVFLRELRPGVTFEEVESALIEGFTDVWGQPRETILAAWEVDPVPFGRDCACPTL